MYKGDLQPGVGVPYIKSTEQRNSGKRKPEAVAVQRLPP